MDLNRFFKDQHSGISLTAVIGPMAFWVTRSIFKKKPSSRNLVALWRCGVFTTGQNQLGNAVKPSDSFLFYF